VIRRLAIVGAGFSGLSLLRQLIERRAPLAEVLLYGCPQDFACGLAYGAAADEAILNSRAADMGLVPERPGEFADWLGLEGTARDAFLSRRLYGDYLRQAFEAMRAASPFPVRVVREEVRAIRPGPAGYTVCTADAAETVPLVALALGPLPAGPLAGGPGPAGDHPRWIDDPWRTDWVSSLREDSRVVILGSGLSMVDHLLRLQRAGVRQAVTVLSRHGLLPQSHREAREAAPALSQALRDAIARGHVRALMAALRAECAAAGQWQAVIDAFREQAPAAWRAMSRDERRRFLRHVRPWWEVHRHRLAPTLAGRLDTWLASGWLRVHAGRLRSARRKGDSVLLTLSARGGGEPLEWRADLVLRATGVEGSYRRGALPAIDPLVDAGVLQADPLGLGFAVDAGGRAIARSGSPTPGLYVLGAAARGHAFEATAVPELRQAARNVAAELGGGHSPQAN
jgi:uncharacterized NAD(P)/FAD-binding protein YdhS